MLNVRILDGQGQDIYAHNKEFKDGSNGLIVATRPYNYYEFKRFDFISDVYGQSMNIGSVYGDTPELVHNGIDSTLWTGANVVGTSPVFNSTGQAYEGTRSIHWNNPVQGSIFQLSKGSDFVFSGYLAVSFWIYVDANYQITDLISFYGYNTSTGQQIGSKVYIQNYFNVATLDVWQKVMISLDDLNINGLTITSFRFNHEVRNGPASPQIYIDKIQVEQAANNQGLFYVKPDLQTWFFAKRLCFLCQMYIPLHF